MTTDHSGRPGCKAPCPQRQRRRTLQRGSEVKFVCIYACARVCVCAYACRMHAFVHACIHACTSQDKANLVGCYVVHDVQENAVGHIQLSGCRVHCKSAGVCMCLHGVQQE